MGNLAITTHGLMEVAYFAGVLADFASILMDDQNLLRINIGA